MRRVGPLSGIPAACAQQRGDVNLPVKFRARATEPSAEPELSLRATASGARLSGCVGPHRLRDSLRGARTSSSHCRGLHLHFPPLSDPQATTFLSPPGGIYLILREGQIWQWSKRFKLKLPRNSGVFTSARLKLKPQPTRPTLRMVTATGRPTGRPTAAADRPTADRRGTRCAPQIARLQAVRPARRVAEPRHGIGGTGRSFMLLGEILLARSLPTLRWRSLPS